MLTTLANTYGGDEILFSDNFTAGTINPPTVTTGGARWVIDNGQFKADGTSAGNLKPVAGELNFGIAKETAIHVDFSPSKDDKNLVTTIQFKLRNSNAAAGANYMFIVRVEDTTVEDGYYDIRMALNPKYFGTSGFCAKTVKGIVVGNKGEAAGNRGLMTITFHPDEGLALSKNGIEVLYLANALKLKKVNRVTLNNGTGVVSYFIDDFKIMASEIQEVSAVEKKNNDELTYIPKMLKKCSKKNYEREGRYWLVRQSVSEQKFKLVLLRQFVSQSQRQGIPVASGQLNESKELEAAWEKTSILSDETQAALKQVDSSLAAVNVPYSWHLVKVHLLRDLINRCQRFAFYQGETSNDIFATAIDQAITLNRQWENDYGNCFFGRQEQKVQNKGNAKAHELEMAAQQLATRLDAMDNKRQALEKDVLAYLNAFDSSGKFEDLGIPYRKPTENDAEGVPTQFILSGLDFGYPHTDPAAKIASPLCFDVLDYSFFSLPMASRGVVDVDDKKIKHARALTKNEGYYFKQPLNVNSYFRPSQYRNIEHLPQEKRQGDARNDLFLQDENGKTVDMCNIWNPDILSLLADNLKAVAKYAKENIPNLLLFEKIVWEGAGLGNFEGVYGYNHEALALFQAKMAKQFGTIDNLNQKWRTHYTGFDQIQFPASRFTLGKDFKTSALSYEFQLFRMESWSKFVNHCIRSIQAGAPGVPVGTEESYGNTFQNGAVKSHRLWKASPATYFESHWNNWPPNYPDLRMHYDLCLYAGKKPIETEWIWVYPRLIKPETEDDFRVTGELSFWRKTVWGRAMLQAFTHFDGWSYNNSYYNESATLIHTPKIGGVGKFVREAATALVVGKKRVREFWPILQKTEVLKPQIALLVPTTSTLNEYPFESLRKTAPIYGRVFTRWNRLLEDCERNFRHVPEEAILDGDESLSNFKVVILPYMTYFPDGLTQKLIAWVNAGGTLIAEGVPGVFNAYGFKTPKLMDTIFGETLKYTYTGDQGRGTNWSWAFEFMPDKKSRLVATFNGQPSLVGAEYGKGQVLVSSISFNRYFDAGENLTLANGMAYTATDKISQVATPANAEGMTIALYRAIADKIGSPAFYTKKRSLEMVMREDRKGKRYLFVINPQLRKTVTDDIVLDTVYAHVIDLGLGEDCKVPLSDKTLKDSTVFTVRLKPGEGTCFELIKTE
ncbi:MAG: beta-galactosidase [Phycisphaeraceae bacterium]|nr:beta-galactosidase [Phycisphaeraceae bacterium]